MKTNKICKFLLITPEACISVNPLPPKPSLVQMYSVRHVDTDEVAQLIRAASPESLPLDCMPTSLLKVTIDVMAPLLTQLALPTYLSPLVSSLHEKPVSDVIIAVD